MSAVLDKDFHLWQHSQAPPQFFCLPPAAALPPENDKKYQKITALQRELPPEKPVLSVL